MVFNFLKTFKKVLSRTAGGGLDGLGGLGGLAGRLALGAGPLGGAVRQWRRPRAGPPPGGPWGGAAARLGRRAVRSVQAGVYTDWRFTDFSFRRF